MADGDPKPTLDGKGAPTLADPEAPLGTMQMPRDGLPLSLPPPMPADTAPGASPDVAAPVLPTAMPSTHAPLPRNRPPTVPPDARYAIDREIARGGMGRVVEATDAVLGRTVALKEALSLDPEAVRRFQRETRITARLEHPAIVPVHDAGTLPTGAPFYVMRKVGGRALEDLVARADTLPKRLALVPHIVTAANAIAHAHERGIVHRDIKPANILCGDLGETIVIDWGLAKAIGEAEDARDPSSRVLDDIDDPEAPIKTRAGIVFGTPGFMAPEQLRGKPVDERCDVYALGATLYHLLARRPPHHDKNADMMMRAAVDGPPRPLVELVPEVPPELATIVDKALAHDASRRYQTARALAEDLQAYLTGAIVGAHPYTARERIVRFVRRNRAAVSVAGVALAALVAGTVLYMVRIRGERDRADEQARLALVQKREADAQRDEVLKKARELTLTNARHVATTDPTRALAMVKPLVASEMWRAARDVGAAARAHGVAFSIPTAKHTLTLELSRDGQRVLAAGNDGKVRLVDLVNRTTKEIMNAGGAVMARYADADRQILVYQGSRLTIIDAATGDKREVIAPTPIGKLETAGPLVYWVDPADAVWRLDLAGGPPTKIDVGEPVKLVSPSPDGRWIAFGGTQHLLLADRSNPTLPPEIKNEGAVEIIAWSSDSKYVAVQMDDEVVSLRMHPVPQIWNRYMVRARYGLAMSAGRVFSTGPRGVDQLFTPEPRVRVKDQHTLGVHEAREHVVISAKPLGEIVVLSDYGDRLLRTPAPIERIATSTRGQWVVAAAEGRLLVWDLEQFTPRSYDSYPPSSARFVTGDAMIVTYQNDTAEWIDLRSGKATDLGELPAIETVVAAPDGAEAIAIDLTRRAWRVAGVGKPQALPGDVDAVAYVDNARLVLAGGGSVRVEDLQKRTKQTLLEHAATVRDLAATDAGWVAASFADGRVFRKNLKAGEGTLQLPAPLPANLPLVVTADGTVVLGNATDLTSWRPDGKTVKLATLSAPIHDLVLLDEHVALALTDDGAGHVVDLNGENGTSVTAHMPMSRHVSPAPDAGLLAGPSVVGGVEVIDPLVAWRWPLATLQKGTHQPFTYVEMARDGSRVLALTQHAVVVWTLALPRTAEDTATWLERTSNATADTPSGPLSWR